MAWQAERGPDLEERNFLWIINFTLLAPYGCCCSCGLSGILAAEQGLTGGYVAGVS